MATKRTGRPPALVPDSLPRSQEVRRRTVVEAFSAWVLQNPALALDRHSTHSLGDPDVGIGVTRKTINRWFPEAKCGGSTWHALCYMAVDLQLFEPSMPPPRFVMKCADTYREWREQDAPADGRAQAEHGYEAMTDPELQTVVEGQFNDLVATVEASAVLAKRLHRKLLTTNGLKSQIEGRGRQEAVETALQICSVANVVVNRVWQTRDTASRDLRENCALVIDAAVDAHRLLSRNPKREFAELGLLLDLRTKDLDITNGVRTAAETALVAYYRDIARALLSYDHTRSAEDELTAIEALIDSLHATNTVIRPDEVISSNARGNVLAASEIMFVVDRIASILVARRSSEIRHRARNSATRLLQLFDRNSGGTVAVARWDVSRLLKAAEVGLSVVGPIAILRIVKFRGVGEVLVARLLVRIATDGFAASETLPPSSTPIELYLGGPIDDERRAQLLERAVGLYKRAVGWLRDAGVAGDLKQVAIEELADAQALLKRTPRSAVPDVKDLHLAISELRQDLERMVVKGLLLADLSSLTNMKDDTARQAAVRLISELNETIRYLKQPEVGLRTDLPLITEFDGDAGVKVLNSAAI